ncbi:LOW QUALITY PROTEIN: snRNA-activating protein complex subunit 4 [Rhopalosiphum maidis]|uniref:LOW QUALITY PROTEIN: snRNA-activating protein complex subunit 4 n=1 Tax=Rhopalosiphum maidis TaxID=43146 RepID=UPI000F00DB70|nr:LOW QUALITY PROTEIN: snRNA-activating protein complex subunit 4 [Rhopalosiphum maidis]
MDACGNPIPGSSKEFINIETAESAYDFTWLENELNNGDANEDLRTPKSIVKSLNKNDSFKFEQIETNPNIQDFFEEINCIDFNQDIVQSNYTLTELLEQCNKFIDILGRNIVYLEEMIIEINKNIEISNRNVTKALSCIKFEKKYISKVTMKHMKIKAHLANFFKIGLLNCPRNPHLMELYETERLILSYNGRFILEECVEKNQWNQEFKNKLEKAIHAEVLNKLKIPMLEQHLRLGIDRHKQVDPIMKHKIEIEMLDLEKELDIISKTPFKQLVLQFMDSDAKYDWLHIAKEVDKPDLQCQRFWNLILKPHISRARWTKSEDDRLIEIVAKNEEKNWQKIADELATNRNELQCFVHYQKYKKMLHTKGKWSKQEDLKLIDIIKENSVDNIINWQRVYFAMQDNKRTVDQIYIRWMQSLKPGIKKGFLTESEKFIIKEAKIKNLPPSIVSMNLTNRTPAQVRNAYRRIVLYDEDIYRGGWTIEEDKMLIIAVNSYAPNEFTWTQVSQQVPGRNAEQCRHRFKLIEKKLKLNPKLTVEDIPRPIRSYRSKLSFFPEDELNGDLQEKFKHNRKLLKTSNIPLETNADRKLKKAYLENKFVINNCNLSSKCDLYRHVLDYLGANLVVPKTFAHKDDLIDDGLMSMMAYISEECPINTMPLNPSNVEHDLYEPLLTHEGVHNVLRTSDIINSDLSEIEGLLDIRIRNFQNKQPKERINTNSTIKKKKDSLLPLQSIGSVPPNHETFKMLYTYMNSLTSSMKIDHCKDSSMHFDWDDKESKKLHKRLVAMLRLPVLFSSLVPYNTPNINIFVNTEEVNKEKVKIEPSSNYSEISRNTYSKNKKYNFNLKNIL